MEIILLPVQAQLSWVCSPPLLCLCYMYVCMYVCMYLCIYVSMYLCMYEGWQLNCRPIVNFKNVGKELCLTVLTQPTVNAATTINSTRHHHHNPWAQCP